MQTNKEPPAFKNPMQIEKRKQFTYEERLEILKSTKGICAHCGKKLKTNTMTVEHVIPIMRGGTNSIENLTALCEECNSMKDNLIYLPQSFYMAIMGTSRYEQMEKMVRDWYREKMTEELDIQMFPLIAPIHQMIIAVANNRKKVKYNKQLILQWCLVGNEQKEETEAITGHKIRTIRKILFREQKTEDADDPVDTDEYFKDCVTDEDYEKKGTELEKIRKTTEIMHMPVTCYTLRKFSSDKIFALVAVRYDKKQKDAVIYIPWVDMTKKSIPSLLYHFIKILFYAVMNVAGEDIKDYLLLSPYKNAFESLQFGYINSVNRYIADYYEFSLQDKQDPEKITYGMQVNRIPNQSHKKVSQYIQIPAWTNLIM